ncbi:MAG: cytochrome c3 family protein, partial [Limisphaerales bacterium]
YDGGEAKFHKEGDRYLMDLSRGDKKWRFHITRTIGWRHFQDYAGYLVDAEDELGHDRDKIEHVLPFSWDVTEKHFMPPVHLHADHLIPDTFEPDLIVPYELTCSDCHNTYPVGDRMLRYRGQQRWTKESPYTSSIHIAGYFREAHPQLLDTNRALADYPREEILQLGKRFEDQSRIDRIPAQGISCEACHYGGREHAENSTKTNSTVLPHFFAVSPHIFTRAQSHEQLRGRNGRNINFTCARCHSGERQGYANGLHSWNSTEYTEAINGPCYDPVKAEQKGMRSMTCTTCHDPHQTIGKAWSRPPQEDDRTCLGCHEQFKDRIKRTEHTHHQPGDGDHCMDCHMPHTNEGLGQMVRTHRIMNPIDRVQIEANQPNACNLCHLDKNIDWTIDHLRDWYAPDFQVSEMALQQNYPNRADPVVYSWLTSGHQPSRIAAAGAIGRWQARFAFRALLEQLVAEPSVYTRRLMQKSADSFIGDKLRERGFEYHFPEEKRRQIMNRLITGGLLGNSK